MKRLVVEVTESRETRAPDLSLQVRVQGSIEETLIKDQRPMSEQEGNLYRDN